MTRKALVLMITVWIASNFGCTGFKAPNLDADNILDSCKVTFVTGSVDFGPREKGTLIITDNIVQFSSSNSTIEIPLTAITHVGPSDSMIMDFPTPLSLNYEEKCPDDRAGFPTWLVVTGLALLVAAVLWILGTFSHKQALLDLDFMVDGVKNFTTLQMTQGEFSRIYPILLDKAELH